MTAVIFTTIMFFVMIGTMIASIAENHLFLLAFSICYSIGYIAYMLIAGRRVFNR